MSSTVPFGVGLAVGFRWSVERMGLLEEVLLWACFCPSLPAQLIEYIKCTLPPLAVIFYLMDVVYKVICAPC